MEIVVGGMIALVNQGLLYWRMKQLKRKNIMDPKQVVNLARISLIERLLLIGILLSFFIINLSLAFYKQCQLKP
jgi:hypothetical protein